MEPALDTYRHLVAEQPACEARFFAQALAEYRAGDESAARKLSASCLRLALKYAEEQAANGSGSVPIFDLIQEANAGLMEAITTFPGEEMQEFLRYAHERMQQRLAVLI